nr:transcription initiation factor TFIID subunit 13 [Tanacetum cinerariifolium]
IVALVEDIVVEYVTDMVHKAQDIASKRGKLLTEDFLFLIRNDTPKLNRCTEVLSMNEELKQARKAFDVDEEKLASAALIRGCKMGGVGNSLIESAVWTPEEVIAAKGVKPTLSPKLDTLALVEEQKRMDARGSQNNEGMENLHHQNLKQTIGENKILDHYIASVA